MVICMSILHFFCLGDAFVKKLVKIEAHKKSKRISGEIKKAGFLASFVYLTAALLFSHEQAIAYAATGLSLWYEKMIPTLVPFMIISGILIRTGYSELFAGLFVPLLKPLFRVSNACIYCIVIGFLCGFPMGAVVISESYRQGKLTREEASYLLTFCNNIGPIYFTGFVLPFFGITRPFLCLLSMYGLPFLYGLFLRYTGYRKAIPFPKDKKDTGTVPPPLSFSLLLNATDASITKALVSIARLGGYMILFNVLNLIPQRLLAGNSFYQGMASCFLEITGGISRMGAFDPIWVLILLPFGGLSCIAQTYSMIKDTDLSLGDYVKHKLVQTFITVLYYSLFWI